MRTERENERGRERERKRRMEAERVQKVAKNAQKRENMLGKKSRNKIFNLPRGNTHTHTHTEATHRTYTHIAAHKHTYMHIKPS